LAAYYNEIDPYAAQWLRNLISAGHIAPGDVDERSIKDVKADELRGYKQCHFFAGIGGWSRALCLAGWDDARPVWTGSCPCQPFSVAGKRKGFEDERHLWPAWFNLISECRPPVVFGEQVARAVDWLDLVRRDLESLGYAVGAIPIEAASIGANHYRDRLWFVADAGGEKLRQQSGRCGWSSRAGTTFAGEHGAAQSLADSDLDAREQWRPSDANERTRRRDADRGCVSTDVADASTSRLPISESEILCGAGRREEGRAIAECSWWSTEPDVGRVAHGVPARVAKLRALGNAIVPQVAAEFIGSVM
jgi:DNA (cytosine-5)-methyltransferase 1